MLLNLLRDVINYGADFHTYVLVGHCRMLSNNPGTRDEICLPTIFSVILSVCAQIIYFILLLIRMMWSNCGFNSVTTGVLGCSMFRGILSALSSTSSLFGSVMHELGAVLSYLMSVCDSHNGNSCFWVILRNVDSWFSSNGHGGYSSLNGDQNILRVEQRRVFNKDDSLGPL